MLYVFVIGSSAEEELLLCVLELELEELLGSALWLEDELDGVEEDDDEEDSDTEDCVEDESDEDESVEDELLELDSVELEELSEDEEDKVLLLELELDDSVEDEEDELLEDDSVEDDEDEDEEELLLLELDDTAKSLLTSTKSKPALQSVSAALACICILIIAGPWITNGGSKQCRI